MLLAQNEAERFENRRLGTEDLLLGLIAEGSGFGSETLAHRGINLEKARKAMNLLSREEQTARKTNGMPFLKKILGSFAEFEASPALQQVLGHALQVAEDDRIQPDDLLLGLLMEDDCAACQALRSLGVVTTDLQRDICDARNNS